jgi:putative phosphoesterase
MARIGVLSDTHGLLRPEATRALAGVDHILHAGDIGDAAILEALARLAPVTAVSGNNDRGAWARRLPQTARVTLGGVTILVTHVLAQLDVDPKAFDASVVVYGHSHRPEMARRGGVLYLNPGSAGPRRFTLPVTVARLHVSAGRRRARIVPLLA